MSTPDFTPPSTTVTTLGARPKQSGSAGAARVLSVVDLGAQTITIMSSEGNQDTQIGLSRDVQDVTRRLLEKYPLITVDGQILGEPRIANSRLAVTDVLSALTFYESFSEVIKEYGEHYSKEELKAAVEFSRDFLDSFYVG